MQDWDRPAIMAVGLAVSIFIWFDGYRYWKQRRLLPVAGVVILTLIALGVPIALTLFAT